MYVNRFGKSVEAVHSIFTLLSSDYVRTIVPNCSLNPVNAITAPEINTLPIGSGEGWFPLYVTSDEQYLYALLRKSSTLRIKKIDVDTLEAVDFKDIAKDTIVAPNRLEFIGEKLLMYSCSPDYIGSIETKTYSVDPNTLEVNESDVQDFTFADVTDYSNQFYAAVTVNRNVGRIYITLIDKDTLDATHVLPIIATPYSSAERGTFPLYIKALDNALVFLVSNSDGSFVTGMCLGPESGTPSVTQIASFSSPIYTVLFEVFNNKLYMVYNNKAEIYDITTTPVLEKTIDVGGTSAAAMDSSGNVYVLGDKIYKYDSDLNLIGSSESISYPGPIQSAYLVVDNYGNAYAIVNCDGSH